MKEEYGSVGPIGFIDHDSVKMYDCERKEVAIPKCEKCGIRKHRLVGKQETRWVCMSGCKKD